MFIPRLTTTGHKIRSNSMCHLIPAQDVMLQVEGAVQLNLAHRTGYNVVLNTTQILGKIRSAWRCVGLHSVKPVTTNEGTCHLIYYP
jgi:hypothetical protein